jgi:hypothetical protein
MLVLCWHCNHDIHEGREGSCLVSSARRPGGSECFLLTWMINNESRLGLASAGGLVVGPRSQAESTDRRTREKKVIRNSNMVYS